MQAQMDNNAVKFTPPEGFKKLTDQEVLDFADKVANDHIIYRDEERNVTIELLWQKLPLLSHFFSMQWIVKNMARLYQLNLSTFRDLQFTSRTVAGLESRGFTYAFSVDGTGQAAAYHAIRCNKKLYAFTIVAPETEREESMKQFHAMLDSVTV